MENKRKMESVDPVELYLEEIRKVPPLSEEEKLALPRQAKAGSSEARNRMAEAHLEMVVEIAREYEGRGLALLDLIQEGNNGLIRAARDFDFESDKEFASFAEDLIRRYIRHALDTACIERRIPVEKIEQINRIMRAYRELEQQLGRDPAPEELARALGLSEAEVHPLFEGPREEDADVVELEAEEAEDPGSFDITEEIRKLLEESERLSPREKDVISFRFGLDGNGVHTLEETGNTFGITRERVRQIENKLIRHRHSLRRAKKIRDFYA